MIKNSVTIHRGCFGGCSFCAIAAHQGKFVVSRSEQSILKEIEQVVGQQGFKGHISDLGGPSANMYRMRGIDQATCRKCKRPSCIFPAICSNLNYDHKPLLRLYDVAMRVKGVKKLTIGSGVRVDMLVGKHPARASGYGLEEYSRRLIRHHVSGRLKVAPEHTEPAVLRSMRKPGFKSFELFYSKFRQQCKEEDLPWQLIPYFISGHPGCQERDMQLLSQKSGKLGLITEQAQEFTPTPMTFATCMYYTGLDPYTGKKIHVARSDAQKQHQKAYLTKSSARKNKMPAHIKMNRHRRK